MVDATGAFAEIQDVQVDVAEVKYALQHDGEFFVNFFLAEELDFPVPDFHIRIWGWLTSLAVIQMCLAIPRGHAKTTLAKLACVYLYLFTDARFVVYLSNTNSVAKDACRDIVNYLRSGNARMIFGDFVWEKESESEGLYIFKIGDKRCILKALGAGQQVRGLNIDNQRPEIAVVDDLEDVDNIATEYLLTKLKRWFYGTFKKALSRNYKIIHLGNMVAVNCMLKDHVDSPDWHAMRLGCVLSNGKPLWPDLWPMDKIIADFREYARMGMAAIWFAEMMNMPVPDGLGLIKSDEIVYHADRQPDDCSATFITIDPAISQKASADDTAIVVHGLVNGRPEIVDYTLGKYDPIALFDEMIRLAFKWHVAVVGIEGVAYQASLEYMFRYLLLERQITGMEIIMVPYGGRKTERIMAWAALIKVDEYAIPDNDFQCTEQLLSYDPTKRENRDDLIDACAYGPYMLQNYYGLITTAKQVNPHERAPSLPPF